MDRLRLVEMISEARAKFVSGDEENKGIRFRTDERVIRLMRMELFQERNLKQLPTMEQFIEVVNEEWVNKNVNRVLRVIAKTDWHYSQRESWLM